AAHWLSGASVSGLAVDRPTVRHGSLLLWRSSISTGGLEGVEGSTSGDDDAHLPRDRRGFRLQRGRDARLSGNAAVGGVGDAGDHHASRSLDRDEVHLSGAGGSEGAREVVAKYRGAAGGGQDGDSAGLRITRERSAADPSWRERSRRRCRA